MKILILGAPCAGKTTLAKKLGTERGIPVRHIDDLIGVLDWSGASAEAARWMEEPGPWIIEGVQGARALRKWLEAHPTGAPADQLILCEEPFLELTKGQAAMAKGCATVWREIEAEIAARGVPVLDGRACR